MTVKQPMTPRQQYEIAYRLERIYSRDCKKRKHQNIAPLARKLIRDSSHLGIAWVIQDKAGDSMYNRNRLPQESKTWIRHLLQRNIKTA